MSPDEIATLLDGIADQIDVLVKRVEETGRPITGVIAVCAITAILRDAAAKVATS